MTATIEKMDQTQQLESIKLLCESLQSTQEETELKFIKADLEKMKDKFEKLMDKVE